MIKFLEYDSNQKAIVYEIEKIQISSVHFVLNPGNQEAIITSVNTIKPFRKQGYATLLLNHLINYLKMINYNSVILDDDSDRHRKPHNIYTNLGWSYIHNWGPEMILFLA